MKFFNVRINNRAYKIKNCKGISSIRGLMFDRLEDKDGALIYANSIWMPFVKQKLKLVFLDSNMNVVGSNVAVPLTLNPKTWKIYKNKKAKYCLELKDTGLKFKGISKIRLGP